MFSISSSSSAGRVSTEHVAPLQSTHLGSWSETIGEFTSKVSTCIQYKLSKLTPFWMWHHPFPITEATKYISKLTVLAKVSSSNEPVELTAEEKIAICKLLSHARKNGDDLTTFDFFIHSRQDQALSRNHNTLKDAFRICNDNFFIAFIGKLAGLTAIPELSSAAELPEHAKISLKDFNVMATLNHAKKLLGPLVTEGSKDAEFALERWKELEVILQHPFFQNLKELCKQSRAPGTIFMGDYHTLQTLNGTENTCTEALTQLFMGRICHIGVFVDQEKMLHLSHVNRMTNTQAVTPVYNPLFLPFSFAVNLDIHSLIPQDLPESVRESLQRIFMEEFQKLASEKHPELLLGHSKEHLKLIFEGHNSIFPTPLDHVDYPPAGSRVLCSSYIGFTFLIAIKRVNEALHEFGYDERIPHPFGEHENLMNLDIVRLLYLWQRIGVVKTTPLHPDATKVISSSCESAMRTLFPDVEAPK